MSQSVSQSLMIILLEKKVFQDKLTIFFFITKVFFLPKIERDYETKGQE